MKASDLFTWNNLDTILGMVPLVGAGSALISAGIHAGEAALHGDFKKAGAELAVGAVKASFRTAGFLGYAAGEVAAQATVEVIDKTTGVRASDTHSVNALRFLHLWGDKKEKLDETQPQTVKQAIAIGSKNSKIAYKAITLEDQAKVDKLSGELSKVAISTQQIHEFAERTYREEHNLGKNDPLSADAQKIIEKLENKTGTQFKELKIKIYDEEVAKAAGTLKNFIQDSSVADLTVEESMHTQLGTLKPSISKQEAPVIQMQNAALQKRA